MILNRWKLLKSGFRKNSRSKRNGKAESPLWMRWLIGVLLLFSLVLMFPGGKSLQFADMKEGSISTRRVVAPFNFEILKNPEEVRRDRELAVRDVYRIFHLDRMRADELARQMDLFFRELERTRQIVAQNPGRMSALRDSLFSRYNLGVVDTVYLSDLVNPAGRLSRQLLSDLHTRAKRTARDILGVGVMDIARDRITNPNKRIIVIENDQMIEHPIEDFNDISAAKTKAAIQMQQDYPRQKYMAQIGYSIVNFFLRPNLIFDEQMYQQKVAEVEAMVPLSTGFVYENEKIVDRNERITPEIRKELVSLSTAMAERGMQEGGLRRIVHFIAKAVFVFILLAMLALIIRLQVPDILKETGTLLLIALIVLIVCGATFLIRRLDASEYLVPAALGAMLLATLFDLKTGYAGAAVLSVLVGGIWGNEYNLTVVSFIAGVIGVITISRLRDRSQVIHTILSLAGTYIIVILIMGFIRFIPLREIIRDWPAGAANGLFTPIVVYGLLPLIESVFGITTDFTLLELSNLNHPLLKRLSMEASGTYHHSITVGNLAEAASQAVSANSLLARVGSYYHDIGKIEKAEYFVENQIEERNPHNKLNPRMSALILMNHVKSGLELADQYKLPQAIKDMIIQHHGTTVMSFFYQKAMSKNDSGDVSAEDYRYPGPKPQTKEAAIVMLADAVEASARALKDPTHSRLKGVVEDLVDSRFKEGQMDESPLTLKDLDRIKESFLMILAGVFHTRVEYPDKEGEE